LTKALRSLKKHTSLLKKIFFYILKIFIIFYIINEIYGLSKINHIVSSKSIFNDDARQQIAPFLFEDHIANNDYIIKYHKEVFMPIGMRLIYENLINRKHIKVFSKIIPYLLYCFFLYGVYLCSSYHSTKLIGYCSTILTLLYPPILANMQGGLPRSFAPVFLIFGLFFLIRSNYFVVGIITIGTTLFYPIAGLICGGSLFFSILFDSYQKKKALDGKNIIFISLIALISFLLLIPSLYKGSKYGQRISEKRIIEFPEAGRDGRYNFFSTPPYPNVAKASLIVCDQMINQICSITPKFSLRAHFKKSWIKIKTFIKWLIFLSFPAIFFHQIFLKKNYRYIRMFIFSFTAIFLYQTALIFEPYLYFPSRYLSYTIPIIFIIIVPNFTLDMMKIFTVSNSFIINEKLISIYTISIIIFIFNVIGKENQSQLAGVIQVDMDKPIFSEIKEIPRNSLLAGWPNGLIDNIPYLCIRRAYLHYETHQAFHSDYVIEMRKRFSLFLNAYFGDNINNIKKLRDEGNVTHMIINKRHFIGDVFPRYFMMFEKDISDIYHMNKGNFFFANYLIDSNTDSDFVLFDLKNIK